MEVILRQDYDGLGKAGDTVNVKPGYARNFLIPRQIAMHATKGAQRAVEMERKARERRLERMRGDAETFRDFLSHVELTIRRKVGEAEKLYGSVTSGDVYETLVGRPDVARYLETHDFEIDKRLVLLDEPIKELGTFEVQVKLHRDVFATLKVHVQGEEE